MEKAYKLRIYPNRKQRILIAKTFGCCRFVYNHYLNIRREKYFSYCDCSRDLTAFKKKLEWLKEVDSTVLQSSLKDLNAAFDKFFKSSGMEKKQSELISSFQVLSCAVIVITRILSL